MISKAEFIGRGKNWDMFYFSIKERRSIAANGNRKKANCCIITAGYLPPIIEEFLISEYINEEIDWTINVILEAWRLN